MDFVKYYNNTTFPHKLEQTTVKALQKNVGGKTCKSVSRLLFYLVFHNSRESDVQQSTAQFKLKCLMELFIQKLNHSQGYMQTHLLNIIHIQ